MHHTLIDPSIIEAVFSEVDDNSHDPYIEDIREKIFSRVTEIARDNLTDKQFTVFYLYFFDLMEYEAIAKTINSKRQTVFNVLNGCSIKGKDERNGGILKKIKLLVGADMRIQTYLADIKGYKLKREDYYSDEWY